MNLKRFGLLGLITIGLTSCNHAKTETNAFNLRFDSIRNLSTGAEVRCKNVPIGKVSALKLGSDYKILVTVNIDKDFPLYRRDTVVLVGDTFIHEQWIEITPGMVRKDPYKSGDTISGLIVQRNSATRTDSVATMMMVDSLIKRYRK